MPESASPIVTTEQSTQKAKNNDKPSVVDTGVVSPLSHIEGQQLIMKEGRPAQSKHSVKKDYVFIPEFKPKKVSMDDFHRKPEGVAAPLEPSVLADLEKQSLSILYAEV